MHRGIFTSQTPAIILFERWQRTLATSHQWPVHLKCLTLVVMVGQQQNSIYAVVVDVSGNVYIADTCNHIIQKIIKCSLIGRWNWKKKTKVSVSVMSPFVKSVFNFFSRNLKLHYLLENIVLALTHFVEFGVDRFGIIFDPIFHLSGISSFSWTMWWYEKPKKL